MVCLQTVQAPSTATAALAKQADLTFAQFVMMTPFPGTVDFQKWEKMQGADAPQVNGIPLTRYWLIPDAMRPKMFTPHPTMSGDEIRKSHAGGLGQLLQLSGNLETFELCKVDEGPAGVRLHFQALPADVCEYRHLHRQCKAEEFQSLGALAREALPALVCRESDAGS